MSDESDPPRKIYGLKTSHDFERANETTKTPSKGPTDVQGMINSANAGNLSSKANSPANRPNEIHALLQQNLQRDQAAGWYKVSLTPDPRRIRRVRVFWTLLFLADVPLGVFAWSIGHDNAIPFVCAVGGIGMFTSVLVWRTWFLRTES